MDAIIIFILICLLNTYFISSVNTKHQPISERYLWLLFIVHIILSTVYILYAAGTASDSVAYYNRSANTDDWFSLWETSTPFIQFLAWPFTNVFGLSYISAMIIFSWLGYIAIVYFYLAARENIRLKPIWGNYSYIEIIFLLPNLHFWSCSLGKGSVILFSLSLFCFGISRFNRRYFTLAFGAFLTYMVRPHILFVIIISIMLSVILTSKGLKNYVRWLVFLAAAIVFFYISDDVAEFTAVEDFNILDSDVLSHRASELGKSSSGVNLQDYGLMMKMFTFWFRPLFFDGQGLMGLLVSFENAFYLFMFFVVIQQGLRNWKHWNGWFRICIFIFLFGSIALAQVTGNLGIAIRQKAQLMPFFFIIFFKAMSYKDLLQQSFVRRKRV